MGHSPGDCRRLAGAAGFPWGRRHVYSWCPPAFFYRLLCRGGLLRCQHQAGFFEGTSAGVRFVLWWRGPRSNESCRPAALCASRQGTLQTARPDSRVGRAHGRDRAADFFQRSAVREISRIGPGPRHTCSRMVLKRDYPFARCAYDLPSKPRSTPIAANPAFLRGRTPLVDAQSSLLISRAETPR